MTPFTVYIEIFCDFWSCCLFLTFTNSKRSGIASETSKLKKQPIFQNTSVLACVTIPGAISFISFLSFLKLILLCRSLLLPPGHRTYVERTEDVQKMAWTSSERLMFVQFTSCVQGVAIILAIQDNITFFLLQTI